MFRACIEHAALLEVITMHEVVKLLNVVYADVQCVSGAVSKSHSSQDEVFTEGSVRYMNPKLLRPFAKARTAATRLCRIHGTRFLNGWAVPDVSLAEVREGLAKISAEVAAERASLLANLAVSKSDWEAKHPEIIPYRSKFLSDRTIAESIGMFVSIYKINPSEVQHEGLRDGISAEVDGLVGKVLCEIAQDVRDSWSSKSSAATTRSRGVLERIQQKLDRLSFVGGDLAEVAEMIESVLKVLPASGPIRGHDFIILSGLMNALADPDRVLETSRLSAEQSPVKLWGNFVEGPVPDSTDEKAASQESGPDSSASAAPAKEDEDKTGATGTGEAPSAAGTHKDSKKPRVKRPTVKLYVPPPSVATSAQLSW